jgi:hypothetical protein
MRWVVLGALALSVAACARLSIGPNRDPKPNPHIEQLYARGLSQLDPENTGGSVDSAAGLLDAYLAYDGYVMRELEARALRKLIDDARQLAKVEVALRRAASDTASRSASPDAPSRDSAALREIERLKDELAKANAELERIRKRLAAPRPPAS